MINFSSICKKAFKHLLTPHNYSIWKGFFYKDLNNDSLLFLRFKKNVLSRMNSTIEACIGILPYCADLKASDFEILEDDWGFDLVTIYKRIMPDKLSGEFIKVRVNASDDESTLNSLNLICEDMKNSILPYIHKFVDLKFLYSEYLYYLDIYRSELIYGLSLKLHEYSNALIYVNSRLSDIYAQIENKNIYRIKLNNGEIDETILKLQKKKPNIIEELIKICEFEIVESEKEVKQMILVKTALLENDYSYLDELVGATEKNSREFIYNMLMI